MSLKFKFSGVPMSPADLQIISARPETTAAIMAQTGLDEDKLTRLVHRFYDKVRADAVPGPIFASRISDWGPHLQRMVEFWSSVALMTGRFHGAPMQAMRPCQWNGIISNAG
ncbi:MULTISPECIES: group III truncated hemoglobin [Thioclava]|uniref:group III truncated hemoglobin n=1 Tax=Thioclava TaxID=285107 RepID=UPI001F0B30E8|nr:group III truncated hemoglobin [Thioclava sp. F34-6]